jgi:hypothetical protein
LKESRKETIDKKANSLNDDGRVFADMSIDGMPPSLFGSIKKAFGVCGRKRCKEQKKTNSEKSFFKLDREEKKQRLAISLGVFSSYLVFTLVFFGIIALFFLFSQFIWFK